MSFVLAKRVIQAHPNGFVGAIVEGRRGIGKSSYCIKVMKEVYQEMYQLDDDEAYTMALKYILFDLDDVINFLKKASKSNKVVPVICWDDAGVHGSSLRWFTNVHQVEMLKAVTDTVRTAVTGFLINCPDRSGLLKSIRNYDDYVVQISILDGHYMRNARGYNMYKLPSGTRRVYKNFEDHYSCYIPKEHYNKYEVIRKQYQIEAVKTIDEIRKKIGRPRKDEDI